MIETTFAGNRLVLDKRGVLYWPALQLLIASDLHLGKGDSLNRHSNPIPALDALDTIARLDEAVNRYRPSHVVCLGDSFHDRLSASRLPGQERSMLAATMASVNRWTWILGNHDPELEKELQKELLKELPKELSSECASTLLIENVTLTHEPAGSPVEIVGHFHPKTSISVGGRKVTGRCYLQGDGVLMMPAFGSYTGGLQANDPAIRTVVGSQPQRFLIYRDRVWPLKASA